MQVQKKEYCYFPGLNFKPDTIQVPFLQDSLKNFSKKVILKQKIAKYYLKNIKNKYLSNHNYLNKNKSYLLFIYYLI